MSSKIKKSILKIKRVINLVINEKSKELNQARKKSLSIWFWPIPFPVPEKIVESLKIHAHRKEYLPIQGLPKLREAISNYLKKKLEIFIPKKIY